jgi:Spy/CpxP family protein refolding chaperone
MAKVLLTGCLSLLWLAGLTASQALAQATSKPAAKAHAGAGPFSKLDLTADQKAQIKSILEQAKKDAQAATDRADKAKIRKAAFEKIKTSVLTADQVKKLEAMKAAHSGPMQGRMHRPMAGLGKKLGLTDDQKTQIKAIMQQARKDAKAATDKTDKIKIMKAAFEKVKTSVLTGDQRKKLEELKAERKEHRKDNAPAKTVAPTT